MGKEIPKAGTGVKDILGWVKVRRGKNGVWGVGCVLCVVKNFF